MTQGNALPLPDHYQVQRGDVASFADAEDQVGG